MDSSDIREKAINILFNKSNLIGYITYDDILDTADRLRLPMEEISRITEHLILVGCILRDDISQHADPEDNCIDPERDRSRLDYEEIYKKILFLEPSLKEYINYLRQIPPPEWREAKLLIIPAQQGNKYARDRIVTMYLKVNLRIALWASQRYGIEISDAIQYGSIGLIIAIDKFDAYSGNNFSTYAPWWIRQIISREARISNSLMYFPVHMREKLLLVSDILHENDYSQDGKSICRHLIEEVMDKLEVDMDTAKQYICYMRPEYSIEELRENLQVDVFSDHGLQSCEILERLENTPASVKANNEFNFLNPKESLVLKMRFGFVDNEPKTLEQVGQILGVTRERVRQIEAKALRKIKYAKVF